MASGESIRLEWSTVEAAWPVSVEHTARHQLHACLLRGAHCGGTSPTCTSAAGVRTRNFVPGKLPWPAGKHMETAIERRLFSQVMDFSFEGNSQKVREGTCVIHCVPRSPAKPIREARQHSHRRSQFAKPLRGWSVLRAIIIASVLCAFMAVAYAKG